MKENASSAVRPEWTKKLRQFERPDAARAAWQIINTLVPYLAILALSYLTIRLGLPVWVTIVLGVPAGGFLLRLFIVFHDCVHGSYLKSRAGLRVLGNILGVLTFTPYSEWRHTHGRHHSGAGNLDKRGIGDVWTMTADEYARAGRLRQLMYRFVRNPFIMFGLGPVAVFLIMNRFPGRCSSRKQVASVLVTDAFIGAIIVAVWLTIGIKAYLLVQLPAIYFGGIAGIWLFYVQHQFDPTYWARSEDWGSMEAALQGSSYYKLPALLRWITGNIGLHHIHHLRPRIPNYRLQDCLEAIPELQLSNPLTVRRSIRSVRLNIWDESSGRLMSFRELSRRLRATT